MLDTAARHGRLFRCLRSFNLNSDVRVRELAEGMTKGEGAGKAAGAGNIDQENALRSLLPSFPRYRAIPQRIPGVRPSRFRAILRSRPRKVASKWYT